MQLLGPSSRKTINWTSGTSTEIYIYPPDGNFQERTFHFRISTATVEAEESDFTFFEGMTRHLMILKGQLELIHEGRYTKQLKVFEQDTFSGEWTTRSKGRVTDFNLMLKGELQGKLYHFKTEPGKSLQLKKEKAFYFLYLAAGNALLNGVHPFNAGDLLCMEDNEELILESITACDLIEISVERKLQ